MRLDSRELDNLIDQMQERCSVPHISETRPLGALDPAWDLFCVPDLRKLNKLRRLSARGICFVRMIFANSTTKYPLTA